MLRPLSRLLLPALIGIVGCYDPDRAGEDQDDSGDPTKADTQGDEGDEGDEGGIDETGNPCDPFAQDCGDGFKCNAFADDGGNSWNANMCVPVDPDSRRIGQSCTIEGEGLTGFDDCEAGATCRTGVCIGLCGGDEYDPTCPGGDQHCAVLNSGTLPICVATCDPLGNDCAENEGCYSDATSFSCAWRGELGLGDVCNFVNDCNPGLACMSADWVPGCPGDYCCTQHCDLYDPSGCDEGLSCAHWFAPSEAPDGVEHVGLCVTTQNYGSCLEGECADPLTNKCYPAGAHSVCAPDCVESTDCPAGPGGAVATCIDLNERTSCVFPCDTDAECPSEMSCHNGLCLN